MKTNIKITETQLKMLMEQSDYHDDMEDLGNREDRYTSGERQEDEYDVNQGMESGSDENLESIKSNVGTLLGNGFEKEKLKEMISGLIDSYQGSSEDNSIPPAPSHEDSMQNQIYESIRKEFNRYL